MPAWLDFRRLVPGIISSVSILVLLQAEGIRAAPLLRVVVLEGDGAINNVRTHRAHDLVVQVRDGDDMPVAGGTVIFQAPITGAGITFSNGQKTFIMPTDSSGKAVARGLRPNSTAGSYEIRVSAAFKLETASATITQINASPSEGRSSKKLLLVGLAAGAVAGGVFAASHGGTSSSPSTSTTGSIIPGTPAFGPPH